MWAEGGFPPDTFWEQTHRSFTNALAGAARAKTIDAWRVANLVGAATVGKLPALDSLLEPEPEAPDDFALHDAKLLHFLRKLQAKGVPMTIERLH